MTLHAQPAIIFADIVLSVGRETRIGFRLFDRDRNPVGDRNPVDVSGAQATLTVTDRHHNGLITASGVAQDNTVSFFLTCPEPVPDVGEYVATIDPNPFNQPRVAQGLVRFDRTANR